MFLQRALLWSAALMLSGCVLNPPKPEPPLRAREKIRAFSLEARLAITRGEERVSANIEWQHSPMSDEIVVLSPIGQTLARLNADAQGAQLTTIDQKEFRAPTIDALGERVLGLRLPLADLPDWVLGRAGASDVQGERDAAGRWRQFTQAGWRVSYPQYEHDGPHALPVLMDLQRGNISVRVRNDQWVIEP